MLPIVRTIRLNPCNKLLHRNVKFGKKYFLYLTLFEFRFIDIFHFVYPSLKYIFFSATSILVSGGIETEWVTNQRGEKYFLKRQNDKFEKFFSEQKTCETKEEWKNCLEVMRTDLPQAFRLNSSRLEKITEFQNRLNIFKNIFSLSIKILYIHMLIFQCNFRI